MTETNKKTKVCFMPCGIFHVAGFVKDLLETYSSIEKQKCTHYLDLFENLRVLCGVFEEISFGFTPSPAIVFIPQTYLLDKRYESHSLPPVFFASYTMFTSIQVV